MRRALLVLLAACGCASASVLKHSVRTEKPPEPEWHGVAYCKDGVAHGWLNVKIIEDKKAFMSTVLHEKKHIEQINAFGNCLVSDIWYDLHKLDAEAEAFCASIAVDTLPPRAWTPAYARARYAGWLSGNYKDRDGQPFDYGAAVEAVGKFCG